MIVNNGYWPELSVGEIVSQSFDQLAIANHSLAADESCLTNWDGSWHLNQSNNSYQVQVSYVGNHCLVTTVAYQEKENSCNQPSQPQLLVVYWLQRLR